MTPHLDIGRFVRLLASTVTGLLLVVGTGVTVSAAGTSDATMARSTKGQYCTDFMNHLSHNLNVPPDRLQSAVARAARSTVDDALARGDLTKAQADSLKKRFANQTVCPTPSGEPTSRPSGEGS